MARHTGGGISRRHVVVIGGSAGAHGPLQAICRALPVAFPAPVLVAIHLAAHLPSHLAEILTHAGPLGATTCHHGQELLPGRIYVAPPDHHLLVGADGSAELDQGPTESGFRPSIDALFRSAASSAGPAVTGVILSGGLTDGVAGAEAIRRAGGRVLVQDPDDARIDILPRAAVQAHASDLVLKAADIPAELCRRAEL